MDWKKEKISASELERRQKEYINAAMAMMKSSRSSSPPSAQPPTGTSAASESSEPEENRQNVTGFSAEVSVSAELAVTSHNGEDSENAHDGDTGVLPETERESENTPETESHAKPEKNADSQKSDEREKQQHTDSAPPDDDRYGVFTADELMKGEHNSDGLKKAAEILEEMTKNTEMMKRLAEDNSDSDTTDFPDFSCDTGEDGGRFQDETQDAQSIPVGDGCKTDE